MTGEKGLAEFSIPDDLPGDIEGNIVLTASLTDKELFGEISSTETFGIGLQSNNPSLTEERAMWNVGKKAPVWLLIAFPGVVLTVWGLIFFVLFQVRKVYHLGEDE